MNLNCKLGNLAAKLLAYSVERESGCREWVRDRSRKGYGRLWWAGKLHQAHRKAFEAFNGPIPGGMHVLHRCDNPSCVNPGHLFLGTNDDNVRDKLAKGRLPRGEARMNAKLTEEAVRAIRASSEGKKVLARRFGVCPTVILGVRRGERWPHVTPASTPEVA